MSDGALRYRSSGKVGEGRCLQVVEMIGGPGRDRTDDLFHAMEARSQTAPQAHIEVTDNVSILAVCP
jgi:hypothetical protein